MNRHQSQFRFRRHGVCNLPRRPKGSVAPLLFGNPIAKVPAARPRGIDINQSFYCCLRFARALMALGVLLVASKAAVADVTIVRVDDQAKLTNGGTTAIVTGSVKCDDEQIYNVGAFVVQATIGFGALVPVGDFPQYPPCSGSEQRFAVPVQALGGAFNPGLASARVSALATGTRTGSQTQEVDVKIELIN